MNENNNQGKGFVPPPLPTAKQSVQAKNGNEAPVSRNPENQFVPPPLPKATSPVKTEEVSKPVSKNAGGKKKYLIVFTLLILAIAAAVVYFICFRDRGTEKKPGEVSEQEVLVDMGPIGNKINVDGNIAYAAGDNKILVPYPFAGNFNDCSRELLYKELKGCYEPQLPYDETDALPEEVNREIISYFNDFGANGFWTSKPAAHLTIEIVGQEPDSVHYAGILNNYFVVGDNGVASPKYGYCLNAADDKEIFGLLVLYEVDIENFEFTDIEDTADPNYSTQYISTADALSGDVEEIAVPEDCNRISAGPNHILGLKEDGTVMVTGDNELGQCDVSDWTDIVSVSAGDCHSVGLRADGTVVAAGSDLYGQCDVYGWEDIIAVSAGPYHTVGLRSNGTVVATGNNDFGECDISDWEDIVAVTCDHHTVGLKADGTVVATGMNASGECDVSDWSDIIAVSAGINHTVGLKSDGSVVTAGLNDGGCCNVAEWKDIAAISAGKNTVGLKADGTVVAVGWNDFGQCDLSDWQDIIAVSAGNNYTVGLRSDGTAVIKGRTLRGRCQLDVSNWKLWDQDASQRPQEGEESFVTAYANVIQEVRNASSDEYNYFHDYVLYDMNLDNIPELIVKKGTCEADSVYLVYTFNDGIRYLGDMSASHSAEICGLYGRGGLLYHAYYPNSEYISLLILKDDILMENELYAGDDYHYFTPLRTYGFDDATGFEWEENPIDENWAEMQPEMVYTPERVGVSQDFPFGNKIWCSYSDDGPDEYLTRFYILPEAEDVYDFMVVSFGYDDDFGDFIVSDTLEYVGTLSRGLVVEVNFALGDIDTRGFYYSDSSGALHAYSINTSGYDGSTTVTPFRLY